MANCSVITFGELLWDILPSERVLGGAPANVAYRLTQENIHTKLISRVGKDALGFETISQLKDLGVDTSFIQLDDTYPTGTVNVRLNDQGNPTFDIVSGVAYDNITVSHELKNAAKNCDLICFGTLIQRTLQSRSSLYELLKIANNAIKFLDINLRKNCWSKESIQQSLAAADYVKLNESEMNVLSELFNIPSENIKDFGIVLCEQFNNKACIVTCGEKGAACITKNGEAFYADPIQVQVVDTIGSGDAFSAGFISKLLKKKSLQACVEYGNKLGTAVAGTRGGMSPTAEETISVR